MTSIYRLCSSRFAANSGMGASLYGGRWNKIGTEAIYAAESPSLAALEVLVHFSVLPRDFTMTEILVPDAISFLRIREEDLAAGWDSEVPIDDTQELGERLLGRGGSVVFSVPSSIVSSERNFVLNPAHPAFGEIVFLPSTPFRFDPRLK